VSEHYLPKHIMSVVVNFYVFSVAALCVGEW